MAAQTHYPAKPNESMLPQRLPAVDKNEGMLSYLRRGRHTNKKTCQLAPIMVRSHCNRQ